VDLVVVASLAASLAAIITAGLGVVVWFGKQRDGLRRSFLVLSLFICLWILGNVFFGVVDVYWQYIISLLSYAFAMGVSVHLLIFSLLLVRNSKFSFLNQIKVGFVGYVVGIVSTIPGLVASGVENSKIITNPIALNIYGLVLAGYLLSASIVLIANKIRKNKTNSMINMVLLGMAISSLGGVIFNLIFPILGVYQFVQLGPASAAIFIALVAYSVIKHGLFDVRLAIVRSVTYTMIIAVLAGIYAGLTFVASSLFNFGKVSLWQTVFNAVVSLGLVFLFQPLKRFFDKVTNKIFYKDNYNTDDFFAKLNKILGFTTDLRGLLEHTATEIKQTLKGEQAFFYINISEGHYISAGTAKHKQLPKADADQLSDFAKNNGEIIVSSLLEDDSSIKRLMISHKIELVLPLIQEGKVFGLFCLGDHLTSSYTNRDIKVLNTISNELIIAIQNALAVQEIREFNITLQQRIANATRELRASNAQLRHLDKAKDEFLSMASHQLRTPLTSVKGYISMIMDGDAGKVTGDQKKLLTEAFGNSERMVGLINDFLSVSRIQTGRFVIEKHPLDLSLVVEQETNSLKQNASARQMELVYEKQPDFPMLDIDEGKIRQVIMNFIDNAIYYSHPGTAINVSMQVQGKDAVFTVKDTGIGVPASERDELFTKFYRASNAKKTRPDGTGVGLFLAKKIVDDHDGKIIFESVEGKGSTFGFSLPIPEGAKSNNLVAADQTDDLKN